MQTATIEKKKFTYDDYLKTPDDKRYELIEGELLMTPSPATYHQWISKNILYELEKLVREKKIGKVFDAPCDVYLDNENVLQPDILSQTTQTLYLQMMTGVPKRLYQRYLRAEPSRHLKATSVSPFSFISITGQKNNLIALIKALRHTCHHNLA